jgi:lipoyl(octanoyl) transferase
MENARSLEISVSRVAAVGGDSVGMVCFEKLQVWLDGQARPGPESMAVDEWLLKTACEPLLRIYRWAGDWASLGYFGKISEAKALIPEVPWVRRWTGGGLVDHRRDWAYTLVVPRNELLANLRGGESYRKVHQALAAVLTAEGQNTLLSLGDAATGAALCFENPVSYDIIDAAAKKLAGAGQRRTRHGLLHQGSVSLPTSAEISDQRAFAFAAEMARQVEVSAIEIDAAACCEIERDRYQHPAWIERR